MQEKFSPLVSIIIPVYNGANFMREAIDSALNQTYEKIEVIVINDGSDDNGETERIALSYGEKVKYISKQNGGVASALNVGIKNMKGSYFSWLSHDDKYSPEKIECQVEVLSQYENEMVIALCDCEQIDENSKKISNIRNLNFLEAGVLIPGVQVFGKLLQYGCFGGCSFLIPNPDKPEKFCISPTFQLQ